MIDYANGGDIRGMIRANEAFLKLATADIKIASSRGGVVAGRAQTRRPEGKDRTSSRRLLLLNRRASVRGHYHRHRQGARLGTDRRSHHL